MYFSYFENKLTTPFVFGVG